MKNLNLLLIAFLFANCSSLAQVGWLEQTSGTTYDLNSVFFINSDTGWAVGNDWNLFSGLILKTTNGGITWTQQTSKLGINFIRFTDDNTGWISGGHIVLKTTNAGENWDTLYTTDGNATCAAYFLTNDIGWIINGYFIKTTDAGQSWDTLYTWSAGPYFFQKMYFWNENNGYINGGYGLLSPDPFLYKTTDGGYSWNPENSPFLSAYYWGISFSFVDDEIGWSASCITHIYNPYRGHISRTEDGGETWERQLTDSCSYSWPHRGFQDVFFINYEKGWVINEDSILYTTDGGENWDFQSTETTELWRSIHFTDENNGWVVGDNGIILHTTTGGVVSVKEEQLDGIPTEYMLAQNFPNPFNPSTTIQYSIKERTPVELVLYDILGRMVEVLVNEEQVAGYYNVNFNAASLASGIYFYRLKAGLFVETKKMLLIK